VTAEDVRRLLFKYPERLQGQAGVELDYVNHRGERANRLVLPVFGSLRRLGPGDPETEWHPAGTWVFDGYDVAKGADRTFAADGVRGWKVATRDPTPADGGDDR
jgi:hypothetical protein